jgi:hypothetical protein
MKVYCNNCKYFFSFYEKCVHKNYAEFIDYPINRILVFGNPNFINKNNNCIGYEKKLSFWESIKKYLTE